MFACCREPLSRDKHSGGISREKAKEHLEIYRRKMMFRILGEQVRKQFESELNLSQMKLLAIRSDYVSLKIEELNKDQTRGKDTLFKNVVAQNFIIVFGCKQGDGVWANT